MHDTDRYTLRANSDDRHRLITSGDSAQIPVDGLVIEAQQLLDDGRALVWLTDDSPHEEALHVYLLDHNGALEDAIEASAAWAAGILDIRSMGKNWVEFSFFKNDRHYRLEIDERSRLRLRLPTGWRYKTFLSTHALTVREIA